VVPATATLAAARITIPPGEPTDDFLRLRPDIHATDGFFAALMERRA
jgi:16S rRNA C967 or C1407 C5-methylase (RsmB/RsmF family)